MTKEEYRRTAMDVVYLAACAVRKRVPEAARVQAMDLTRIEQVASRHMLTAIAAAGLESAGVKDRRFTQARGRAIRKVILMDTERTAVLERLEQAGIWYMPLKGSLLKELYPSIGMREMADNDILYDRSRSDDVRRIMEELGFTTEHFGAGSHDVYFKPPVCNFEMHRELFGLTNGESLYRYYRDIKQRLQKDATNRFGYHFTPEDFYIYLIAHEYRHYSYGGTGLRSLLDVYVYLDRLGETLDWDYMAAELEQLGLTAFERQNRTLARHLFDGDKLREGESEMLDYLLSSGTYGTVLNLVQNQVRSSGGGFIGRVRYVFRRVFIPMETVRYVFPLFARCPILLPLLPFYRLYRGLVTRRGRIGAELRALTRHPEE